MSSACPLRWLKSRTCPLYPKLHFSNPSVYKEIYNLGNKWDKDHHLYYATDLDSFFGSPRYPEVKLRRGVLNPFFSKASIVRMQHLVQERVSRLPRVAPS